MTFNDGYSIERSLRQFNSGNRPAIADLAPLMREFAFTVVPPLWWAMWTGVCYRTDKCTGLCFSDGQIQLACANRNQFFRVHQRLGQNCGAESIGRRYRWIRKKCRARYIHWIAGLHYTHSLVRSKSVSSRRGEIVRRESIDQYLRPIDQTPHSVAQSRRETKGIVPLDGRRAQVACQ